MQYIKQRNDREEGELMITKTVIQSPRSERVIKRFWLTCAQHNLSAFRRLTTASYLVLLTHDFNADVGRTTRVYRFRPRIDEAVAEEKGPA